MSRSMHVFLQYFEAAIELLDLQGERFPDPWVSDFLTQSGTQLNRRFSLAPCHVPPRSLALCTTTAAFAKQYTYLLRVIAIPTSNLASGLTCDMSARLLVERCRRYLNEVEADNKPLASTVVAVPSFSSGASH